jgi:hypothetical protein
MTTIKFLSLKCVKRNDPYKGDEPRLRVDGKLLWRIDGVQKGDQPSMKNAPRYVFADACEVKLEDYDWPDPNDTIGKSVIRTGDLESGLPFVCTFNIKKRGHYELTVQAEPEPSDSFVQFYDKRGFTGRMVSMSLGDDPGRTAKAMSSFDKYLMSDQVSSVRYNLPKGVTLKMYSRASFKNQDVCARHSVVGPDGRMRYTSVNCHAAKPLVVKGLGIGRIGSTEISPSLHGDNINSARITTK